MSLTAAQRWAIGADLSIIKALGFDHIRILTMTTGGDPSYAKWPRANFLSFPIPSPAEIANLGQFLAMTSAAGMTCEIVLIMADAGNLYYENGVTKADYVNFIGTIWPAMWQGSLNRIYLGGDLRLGANDDPTFTGPHRQFILDVWPYLVSLCPTCGFGLEVQTQNATFWDRGADSLAWIRNNLLRAPNYVGCQLYPTTHSALQALGFEDPSGVVDWTALTRDWIEGMRAAAGPIQVFADEVGMAVGSEFTEVDQVAFLSAAYTEFNSRGVLANLWEFGDHPAVIGDTLSALRRVPICGDLCRNARAAANSLSVPLAAARALNLRPGIQYTPPEYDDLAWLL